MSGNYFGSIVPIVVLLFLVTLHWLVLHVFHHVAKNFDAGSEDVNVERNYVSLIFIVAPCAGQ